MSEGLKASQEHQNRERIDVMAIKLLTECPYCHRRVSYFAANVLKTKGEHCCKGCKCNSNVVIHRALFAIASFSVVISLLTLVIYTAFGDHSDPRGILYVFIPFLIFYLITPFFIKLEPCPDRSAVSKVKRNADPVPTVKREKINKKQPKPIELDVSDDFTASFMKAKSSVKAAEIEYDENDSRIIREDDEPVDIESGLDYDISASVNEEASETEPEEEEVRIYHKASDDSPTEKANEVSFVFGKKTDE